MTVSEFTEVFHKDTMIFIYDESGDIEFSEDEVREMTVVRATPNHHCVSIRVDAKELIKKRESCFEKISLDEARDLFLNHVELYDTLKGKSPLTCRLVPTFCDTLDGVGFILTNTDFYVKK